MSTSNLPGVKVGPLDPDSTSQFGTVSQQNSARQLVRLHHQMYPQALLRHLARPLDPERTMGLDLGEVEEYLRGQTHDNGDPLLPEDAELSAAAVRGDRAKGQVLTFIYTMPSGRVGKWHAPYGAEQLPTSFDQGSELAKVRQMKDRGVVAFDAEGTATELLRRRSADLLRENRDLRRAIEQRGEVPEQRDDGEGLPEVRDADNIVAQNEELRRQIEELTGKLQALGGAASIGGVPTGGIEEALPPQDQVASADPPFDGYDELKADEVVSRLRAEETSEDDRRAILEYERGHANRKSVVSAAEQSLG